MISTPIQRRILRNPAEDIAGTSSLPFGTRVTNHRSFTASIDNAIRKLNQVMHALAPNLWDNGDMGGKPDCFEVSGTSAESASAGGVEDLEGQPVPSVAHESLNRVESAAPREQLAIQCDRRESRREPLRRIQRVALAGNECGAIPHHSPAVQLLRHQPPGRIGTLPVFEKREHGENLPATYQQRKINLHPWLKSN